MMAVFPDSAIINQIQELMNDLRYEFCNSSEDSDVQGFLTQLSNSVDSRNILTISELEEYQSLVAKISEDECNESVLDLEEATDEDNNYLIEEMKMADSQIDVLTQLERNLNKEIKHVSSGMHQLQQREKAAHYDLVAEARHCLKINSNICSLQEVLLKKLQNIADTLPDYENMKKPQVIRQLPFETYKKLCCNSDHYVKTLMNQLLDWNRTVEKSASDKLDELEESYIEMKVEYLNMLALEKGKNDVIKYLQTKLNEIQGPKHVLLSVDDIRGQSLILKDKVNRRKEEVLFLLENEVLPCVQDFIEVEAMNVKNKRNEYKLCKQKTLYKQLCTLSRGLDAGHRICEFLILPLAIERQRLYDTADLWQLCHQEMMEDYSQYLLRMKTMQELKEKHKNSLKVDSPLVQCVKCLLNENSHSERLMDSQDLVLKVKKINQDIKAEEEKRLALFNREKIFLRKSEICLRNTDAYLCSGLTGKVILQNLELFTTCDKIEQLIGSCRDTLEKLAHKYEEKKVFFLTNVLYQEQRFLWIYFLLDPKKLITLTDHLMELHERKFTSKRLPYSKKKI